VVGHAHVLRVLVGGGVHGDSLDPQLVGSADDADGDLATVRDEDAVEHVKGGCRA
jgi:hypothetical protein